MFLEIINLILPFVPVVLIIGLGFLIIKEGYVKAPPDVAYIISGLGKEPRILVGRAGLKVPFFERLDTLALGAIQIDVKSKSAIPTAEYINIKVDSTVSVRVNRDPKMIKLAAQNFLNVSRQDIARKVNDLLEGNVREIVGRMHLTEMVSDRKKFSEEVQANAVPDLAKFGLELVSFNVQDFSDQNDVITNLGIDNIEQIRKKAAIAKSDAEREIAVAKAENERRSNEAQVAAKEDIAIKNNALELKQSALKTDADTARAKAEAAKAIEMEKQRQLRDVAATEADIARQEKEIELKEREVAIKERALEAEIKKTAEAEKYAAQQRADAALYSQQKASEAALFKRQKDAEAEKFEAEKQAEAKKALADAVKAQGIAEAEATKAKGEAEASAIQAKLEAEAEGMMKKAEAMKQYQGAAMADMQMQAIKVYFEQLPEIAKAIGEGYNGVDKIVMLGGDSTQLAGNIMNTTSQISEGMAQTLGIDLKTMLASFFGSNLANQMDAGKIE